MIVTLNPEGGRLAGKAIRLGAGESTIGRDPKCDIRIEDEAVSRVHCTLLLSDSEILVRDEKSVNGTFVNTRRLRGEWQLEDGDSLQVGPQLFSIRIEQELIDVSENQFVLMDDLAQDGSGSGTTILGSMPVIDPDELQDAETERLRNRLGKL